MDWEEELGMCLRVIVIVIAIYLTLIGSVFGICELVAKADAKNISSIEAIINNEKVILTNIDKIYYDDTSNIYTKDGQNYKIKEFKVNKIK